LWRSFEFENGWKDIYVGADERVVQWVFREGGGKEPSLITTWERYRRLGPLLIPTEVNSQDGKFKLWFSGLLIRLKGSNDFLHPE